MFKNYLKITLRNLYREKLYALLNILGLALGMGCCVVLGLHVAGQLSYDRHWENHERIYRLVNEYTFSGTATSFAWSSQSLGPLLIRDYPDVVETYTRFRPPNGDRQTVFRRGVDTYFWDGVYLADLNVFDTFRHDIIAGDPQTALDDGLSIAVSETFARTYFGDENPIGQLISTDTAEYHITLVFADLPETSHLQYDVLISINRLGAMTDSEAALQQMLGGVSDFTYVRMSENFDAAAFPDMFARFKSQRVDAMARTFGLADFSARFWSQPLADTHLISGLEYDRPTGNRFYIYSFIAIGLFTLIIACINYVNLATARSMKRAREVGMRKVLGAQRTQLVWQFLGESVVFALAAFALTLFGVHLLLEFNLLSNLLGSEFYSGSVLEPRLLAAMLGLSLLVGILSGLYPAFYLSSVAPIVALSNSASSSRSTSGRLRQLLVFLQFTISIAIIAGTLLMANQLRYVSNLSLGFNKENKLLVPLRGADLIESATAIRSELATNPSILSISTAQNIPGGQLGLGALNVENQSGAMELQTTAIMAVGPDFISTMGIELSEGRDFSQRLLTDVGQMMIVNRTLVNRMGWDQPIGKRLEGGGGGMTGRVIGVVEDFHYASLHQSVGPLVMLLATTDFRNLPAANRPLITQTLILNIAGQNIAGTLEFVRDLMQRFDPSHPFEFEFLDNNLNQLYVSEQSVMKLISIFSGICIFISCLGLFGLASFTTERRTKEIGVRKVLGASSMQIIMLLSRPILLLVAAGAVLATLASYLTIDSWLSSFAYRDAINPGIFLLAAAGAVVIAFLTVAMQSWRTIRANPVIALRYE